MDSILLKKFGKNARETILMAIRESSPHLNDSELEKMGIQIYLKILILKYMEENGYIEKIFFYSDNFKERLKNTCLEHYYIWDVIFNIRRNFEDSKTIDFLLGTEFLDEIVYEKSIDEEKWKQEEIIGWLYQFYISDINNIKDKKAYDKKDIPFTTQIFTPSWIVKYLVQNTIGKVYYNNNPNTKLIDDWEYFDITSTEFKKNENIFNIEYIKCLDPASGSGNILLYLFDILYSMYLELGYENKDIPKLILKNNIYGLELDPRVYAISAFSLLAKSLRYDENILKKIKSDKNFEINVVCIEEITLEEFLDMKNLLGRENQDVIRFIKQFIDTKVYGSLTIIEKFSQETLSKANEIFKYTIYKKKVEHLISQYRIMNYRYDITVTNPPYMGVKNLNIKLRRYIEKYYELGKYDLYSAFFIYCMEKTKKDGEIGLMIPFTWMFIKSYTNLRKYLIENKNISNLIQLEYSSFNLATVPICILTLNNYKSNIDGKYIKLSQFRGAKNQEIKVMKAVKNNDLDYIYKSNMENYKLIPQYPIAYWADEEIYNAYENATLLDELGMARQGLATGNNKLFLKYWFEVDMEDIGFDINSVLDFHNSKKIFAPYNKGGKYRKWYGNLDYLIKFDKKSYEKLSVIGNKLPSRKFYFKEGITWSFVNSSYFGVRYSPRGFVFDVGGSSVFFDENLYYILGLLCSKLSNQFMNILNPTLNYQVGDVKNIPVIIDNNRKPYIDKLVKKAIEISKIDYDSFEESWNFRKHRIFQYKFNSIEEGYFRIIEDINSKFEMLKYIEEELNREFIEIYNMKNLDYTVDNRDITVTRILNEFKRSEENAYVINFREFSETIISYLMGILLGRFTLDGDIITSRNKFNNYNFKDYRPKGFINIDKIYVEMIKILDLIYDGNGEVNLNYIIDKLDIKTGTDYKQKLQNYMSRDYSKYIEKTYKKFEIYFKKIDSIYYRLV